MSQLAWLSTESFKGGGSRREQLERTGQRDTFAYVPTGGIEHILEFLRKARYCSRDGNGCIEMLPQTVIAYCELLDEELNWVEREMICELTCSFASSINRYTDNPDATDPYGDFVKELTNG